MSTITVKSLREEIQEISNEQPTPELTERLAEIMSELDDLISLGEVHLGYLSRYFPPKVAELEVERICDDLRNSTLSEDDLRNSTFNIHRTNKHFSKHERQARTLELLYHELGCDDKPQISTSHDGMIIADWQKSKLTWLIKRTSLSYPAIKVCAVVVLDNKPPEYKRFRLAKQLLEYSKTVMKAKQE